MAKIILNDDKEVKGLLTASRKRDDDGNIVVSGELLSHRYIEYIGKIETERYVFDGVDVYGEEFASNDLMIRYEFFAKSMTIKGYDKTNNETNLPEDVLEELEKDYFKTEERELLHKEEYEKWKLENKN